VVYEDDSVYVFLAPASLGGMEGHTLVVPRRHVETIFDLTDEEAGSLARTAVRAARMLRSALDLDGLIVVQRNGVVAEQTVPHVHLHLIPRRAGVAYPPTEWVPVTPSETRGKLSTQLRAHWDLA
jgi:histidine triad (HIT) family protein